MHMPPCVFRKKLPLLVFSLIGATFIAISTTQATPYRPATDSTVLAIVPPAAASIQTEYRKAQIRLATNPNDLTTALEVARLAIRDGRASADPRRFGQAQAALSPWWSDPDAPINVRVLRAIIRQSLHDFRGAEADLDSILANDPRNGQARLTRAFIRQTVGELDKAKDDCRRLPPTVGITAAAVCRLRTEALTGSADKALPRLDQLSLNDQRAEPQVHRWAQAVGADMAAMLGQADVADLHFTQATADGGGDIPTLVAWADHLLDTNRPAKVLTLLADRSEADIVYLRLAIAGKCLNDPRTPLWIALLAERFAAARASGNQLHLREEARFELEVLGNAAAALKLALANWKIQKEPSDIRLVLQAALAANDPQAVDEVFDFIKTTGLADVRITPLIDKFADARR